MTEIDENGEALGERKASPSPPARRGGSGGAKRPGGGDSAARPPGAAGAPATKRSLSLWSILFVAAVAGALVMGQWTLLIAILGLAFLITVHEFGHFIAAKAFGMRVEKFYVGFPPAAVRRTWGETEYGVGIIPLGGFCKISGMTPEEDVPEGTGERVYHAKPVWQRNVAIAAGPLMNFVAAAVILMVFIGVQGLATATLTLDEVVPGSPAAEAGLQPGDTLIGADGNIWSEWEDASAYFRAHPGEEMTLTYAPGSGDGGAPRTVSVTLGENPEAPGSGYLGVRAGVERERLGAFQAVWLGLRGFRDVAVGTFTGFWWLISGKISATGPEGAVGPVGIIDVSRQAVQQDWYPVLLAFLSFNLGLINLLPILPFDGGHIVVNTIERIRGRRIDTWVLERVVTVGVVLLIMLFVFLTFNDVKRIFGG